MAKNVKFYSAEMRELSLLSMEELDLYAIRWGIAEDIPEEDKQAKIEKYGFKKFSEIPPATPVRVNALRQIQLSLIDDVARAEWANRVEGRPTQTNVNVNHDTTDGIEELEKYSMDSLNKLFAEMGE